MNGFYIVDFTYDKQQTELTTTTFRDDKAIIDFVADKSKTHESFEIERIFMYDNTIGELLPYELQFVKGKITLVPST